MAEADVVVIGAGAGGGACAWALAERGVRVLILEAGPRYDPARDYRLDRADWEQTGFPDRSPAERSYSVAPLQPLDHDGLRSWSTGIGRHNRTDLRQSGGYHHVAGVGGTTLHFTAEAHRFHPEEFRQRWPIGYDALAPAYERVETLLGVAGPAMIPGRPRSAPPPLPPHPLSYASQKLRQGFRALGLELEPGTAAILSRPHDDRPPCNYCSNCTRGCQRGDKGSADVTFLRHAERSGRVTIRPNVRAMWLEASGDDRVKGVVTLDGKGALKTIKARAYVVACGGILTPRLLFASAGPHAPAGLGNESGQLGRNLMESVFWAASGLTAEPVGSYRDFPGNGVCWAYSAPGSVPGLAGGVVFATGVGTTGLTGPIAYAERVLSGWGKSHKEAMRRSFGQVLSIAGQAPFVPNGGSFVDLDPVAKDAAGLPLARIHSRLEQPEVAALEFIAGRCRDVLKACGAATLVEEYGTYDFFNTVYARGTCRMGNDPETSVVDGRGRSHRWKNLFIADASVFPSSGGGDAPTLTIEALAVRTGDEIADLLGRRDL